MMAQLYFMNQTVINSWKEFENDIFSRHCDRRL